MMVREDFPGVIDRRKLEAPISCAKQNHTYIRLINEPPKRFASEGRFRKIVLGSARQAVSNKHQWMGYTWVK
jgi:hypothetical protein